eukprot:CAMPEP_0117052736 /NCGR_PEP_ID=MMETSP0472-20121206/36455_1 /TAXON_ID=693140 ORGANISM="Tiarina fusus, Strain LIS" /NCGR_SAMPLE_ID=MMETSP0472 /ASSEMBLY_ACC=CAM_ASM_000603 /LENGTH=266 /DNA_ID=CAMNT_0004767481 /DNA_START=98 /DNA_END=894 /DNA_ORIENTATION=+
MLLPSLTTFVLLLGSARGFTSSPTTVSQSSSFRQNCGVAFSTSEGYIPPDFSVIDDDGDDTPRSKRSPPPAITIEGEEPKKKKPTTARRVRVVRPKRSAPVVAHTEKSDTLSEEAPRPRQPRAKPPPHRQEQKMSITNWMEKNEKFVGAQQENGSSSNNNKFENAPATTATRSESRNTEGPAKTFRQDFRGTRVFVQGIPPGIPWQDLKDHFRVAGDVVFASVSVDPATGESKGHGIVQFETTEMARNAIDVMRDHPLNGSQLYVR